MDAPWLRRRRQGAWRRDQKRCGRADPRRDFGAGPQNIHEHVGRSGPDWHTEPAQCPLRRELECRGLSRRRGTRSRDTRFPIGLFVLHPTPKAATCSGRAWPPRRCGFFGNAGAPATPLNGGDCSISILLLEAPCSRYRAQRAIEKLYFDIANMQSIPHLICIFALPFEFSTEFSGCWL